MSLLQTWRGRRHPTAAPADPEALRDQWHRFVPVNGALTCCTHCTPSCRWANWHPHPCTGCITAMQTSPPLPSCRPDTDGRCATCAQLHGVRITHRRGPR